MMRQRAQTVTPVAMHAPPASPSIRRGLYAYVDHRVVELLTEQQLVDHAVSVLPQLESVTSRPHFHGPHWTTLHKKNGVDLYEFDPSGSAVINSGACTPHPLMIPRAPLSTSSTQSTASSTGAIGHTPTARPLRHGFQSQFKLPNPGIDMAYAVVAQCDLDCHINDAMDVLFSDEPIEFENSMKALWNNKLKRGDLLLTRSVEGKDDTTDPHNGSLAIKTATVGNGLSFKWKQHDFEKLCYTSYTQRNTAKTQAFHVTKTLPMDIHEQIVSSKTHAALRDRNVDHIAVGYHLTGYDSLLGGGPRTRIVVCAYASPASPSMRSRASELHWHPRMTASRTHSHLAGGESAHSDVRRIVQMLAKAACNFHQVIRQRRFGNQRFVYFPTERSSCFVLEQCCVVCLRRFGLFRKDHYCQLCGHLVCRQCSKKDKVEPMTGKVRENRMCFPCVARVDTGAFHEEKLWKNMNRPVVVDAEAISPVAFPAILEVTRTEDDDDNESMFSIDEFDRSYSSVGTDAPPSVTRQELQVAHDLFSPNPNRRASALEALSVAVHANRNTFGSAGFSGAPATPREVPRIDQLVEPRMIKTPQTKPSRRGSLGSKSGQFVNVQHSEHRTAPGCRDSKPSTSMVRSTEASHRKTLSKTRASLSGHLLDTSTLNSICEVAMQRLDGAVAFIIAFEARGRSRIIGLHNTKEVDYCLPHDHEIVHAYPQWLPCASGPVVVNEPTRDSRFREFSLVHNVRARFFAQFPITSVHSGIKAALCVVGTHRRDAFTTKEEVTSIRAVCSLAADLIAQLAT